MASTLGLYVTGDVADSRVVSHRKRRISRESGRALEILGHAIEYLTDEMVYRGEDLRAACGELEAVQILMDCNRQVYFACPLVPTFRERCLGLLRLPVHEAGKQPEVEGTAKADQVRDI